MHQMSPTKPKRDNAAPDQITMSKTDEVSFSISAGLRQSKSRFKAALQRTRAKGSQAQQYKSPSTAGCPS
ncbi:hypothetical protein Z946_287 [Sulfitobacter noctilucicola]|nr:hypothetical protein Z946_287 [Sulfitobacter noctilucicola]